MRKMKLKYGVSVDERFFGWDVGIGISGGGCTTCIYIHLFKWIINIGKILKPVESEDVK